MFLKTGELKKLMKSALKSSGLTVGNRNGYFLVSGTAWELKTEIIAASNKFKAVVMELIGDIPEPGECYIYRLQEGQTVPEYVPAGADLYDTWKLAKDYAVTVPVAVITFPHEYNLYQVHSNHRIVVINRALAGDIISMNELPEIEHAPGRPAFDGCTLIWKNDTTIWRVVTEPFGEKYGRAIFSRLEQIDFSDKEWPELKRAEEDAELDESSMTGNEAGDIPLPY